MRDVLSNVEGHANGTDEGLLGFLGVGESIELRLLCVSDVVPHLSHFQCQTH